MPSPARTRRTTSRHTSEVQATILDHESSTRMLCDVSHAFQTPLTVLKSSLELLRADQALRPHFQTLSVMQHGVDELSHLTRNLLQLARMDAQPELLQEERLNLSELTVDVADYVRVICIHYDITLEANITPNAYVFGNRNQLTEMVTNLLSNSVKYTKSCSFRKITVTLSVRAGSYMLTVADTGVGILPKRIPNIFVRFYRDHRKGTNGAGLGLAIVKGVVQMHGGTIEVESSVGKGTCMIVVLPAYTGGTPSESLLI